MGLPEINRARIEQLQQDLNALAGDFENYNPTDPDNLPDEQLNAPTNVVATGLFRTIMLSWAYNGSLLVKEYEVYASQNAGFTPLPEHLVYRGNANGYNHAASLGETWYFRIRVLNQQDTPSDYSVEVSASTVNIKDYEIEEKYRIDTITYANQYTDARKDEILLQVADKLDASVFNDQIVLKADITTVQERFATVEADLLTKAGLTYVDGQLVLKADQTALDGIGSRLGTAETTITNIEGELLTKVSVVNFDALTQRVSEAETSITQNTSAIALKASTASLDALTQRVSEAEASITVQAGEIQSKVSQSEYDLDINDAANGLIARMNSAETTITQQADEIALKASQSELDTRMGDVVDRLDSAESSITVNATAITQRVLTTTFDALAQRVTTAETSITSNADAIALKASQSDLDGLDGRLDTAEATLTVQAGQIATKVEKNGVISSINQTPEMVKISASLIDIDGDLTVLNGLTRLKELVVDSIHIKDNAIIERMISDTVITNVINAGTANIDFAKIANVLITNAQITSLDASKITTGIISADRLSAASITSDMISGKTVTGMNIIGSSFESTGDPGMYIRLENGNLRFVGALNEIYSSYEGLWVKKIGTYPQPSSFVSNDVIGMGLLDSETFDYANRRTQGVGTMYYDAFNNFALRSNVSGKKLFLHTNGGSVETNSPLVVNGSLSFTGDLSNEALNLLTFSNSWTHFSTSAEVWERGSYWRDRNGIVHLSGLIKNGTTTNGTVIATLPTGYRPAKQLVFLVCTISGTARIDVYPNGQVIGARDLNATWTSLAGISFKAA